jgi:hypothetical protein
MQTILNEENLKNFLSKKLHEVDGHNTIAKIQAEEMMKEVNYFNQADLFYKLGKSHGDMESRVEFVKEIMKYFEL